MRITFLILFCFSLTFFSCSESNPYKNEGLSYLDFQEKLKMDMSFNSLVSTFGNPQRDAGSGIHIYVYQLNDNSEVWIGFVDHILYARHLDQNQQLLENVKFLNSTALVTGADIRMCACCGGWFVTIDGIIYQFDTLPDGSTVDLQKETFPVTVKMDWQISDQAACPNKKIIVQRLVKSSN